MLTIIKMETCQELRGLKKALEFWYTRLGLIYEAVLPLKPFEEEVDKEALSSYLK